MNPKISQIIEKLDPNKVKQTWITKEEASIKAIKLIMPTLKEIEEDILYIGRVSEWIYGISPKDTLNLMMIEDRDLSPEMINNDTFNIILIKQNISLELLFNEVQDILLDSYYLVQSSAALLNSIIQGRGLQYIMEIARELLGNPVMLGDTNHRILAYSKCDGVEDEAWNELRETGYCTYEYTIKYDFKKWVEKSSKSNCPIIVNLGESSGVNRIFSTVKIDGIIVGHLAVLEHRKTFIQKDLEIVTFICDVISSEMLRNKHYFNARNVMLENLMLDLLKEDYNDRKNVTERIKYLKWKLPEKMYVLAIRYNSYEDTFGLIPYMRETIKALFKEEEIVFFENNLIMLLGCDEQQYLKKEDFKAFSEFLKSNQLTAGISQGFNDVMGLRQHYLQAVMAMQLGQKVEKERAFFMYEDYAIYHMIELCAKDQPIEDFCHPIVLKLQKYDARHNTEYLKSLYTYIANMRNLAAAADMLFIHRNTMSYRLTKIQEMLGIELNDEDLSMKILITYKILEYVGKL